MYAIQTQKYFVMHVISKQVQVKGQGIKFKASASKGSRYKVQSSNCNLLEMESPVHISGPAD